MTGLQWIQNFTKVLWISSKETERL